MNLKITFPLLSILILFFSSCNDSFPLEMDCKEGRPDETFSQLEKSRFPIHVENGSFNPGYTNTFWWIKTTLTNRSNKQLQQYITINNPHINRITVLDREDQKGYLMGDKLPFHFRPVNFSDFAIPVSLGPLENKTIFLGIDKMGESLQFKAELTDENSFQTVANTKMLLIGLVTGWMLFIIFILLLIWFYTKEIANIHYALYIASITLWIISNKGVGFQLIWPDTPTFNNISRFFFLYLAQFFFAQALLKYFSVNNIKPILQKLLNIESWIALTLIPIILNIKPDEISPPIRSILLILLAILFGAFVIISSLYIFFNWKARVKYSKFYFWGMLFFVVISICQNIFQFGINSTFLEFLYVHGASMSIIGETSIIAVGFIYKFNEFKKEKEIIQAELLAQQFALSKEIIDIQELERKRIGQDIHDSIGGLLATMKIYLEKASHGASNTYLNNCIKILNQCMHEVRTVIDNLVPQNIHLHGLCRAYELFIAYCKESTSTNVMFFHQIQSEFSISSQTVIYRILTELLNNSNKHAGASEININIIEEDNELRILFEDNGKGFNPIPNTKGHGLKNISNRVKFLQGTIETDSSSQGSTFIINIPLHPHLTKQANNEKKDYSH